MEEILRTRDALSLMRDWVYNNGMPDEELYANLLDALGEHIEFLNFYHGWGYQLSNEFADKLMSLWNGSEDRVPIRPRYTDEVIKDRGYDEMEYMVRFIGDNVFPLYLDKKKNTNNSYVSPVEDVFGDMLNEDVVSLWKNYVESLPRDYTVVWNDIGETDVNLPWIMNKYGLFDAIISIPGMEHDISDGKIDIEEDLVWSIIDAVGEDDLLPLLDDTINKDTPYDLSSPRADALNNILAINY